MFQHQASISLGGEQKIVQHSFAEVCWLKGHPKKNIFWVITKVRCKELERPDASWILPLEDILCETAYAAHTLKPSQGGRDPVMIVVPCSKYACALPL